MSSGDELPVIEPFCTSVAMLHKSSANHEPAGDFSDK